MEELARLTTVFDADTSGVENALASTDAGLNGLAGRVSDGLASAGQAFTGMGMGIVKATAPAIAGIALMVNSALGFGTQMTNIQAVTHMSNQEIAGLSDNILDVDSTFSNVELAGTFYDIAGSVTDASQRIPIFNAAIATAEAGNADLQVTTAALTSTMNAYGPEALSAAHASDLMTQMVAMGVGQMGEFAAALPQVTGLAAATGVSFDEIASSMAFLTTKGNTPAAAVTQLSAAMVSLLNPNETMKEALAELGYTSGEALIQAYGLAGALAKIQDTDVVAQEGLAKTVGSVEALRATTSLASDSTEDLQVKMGNFEINLPLNDLQKFNAGFREGVNNATAMAQAIQMGDTAAQIKLVKGEMDDLAVIAGGALAPALFEVTQEVKPVIKAFASFAKDNPRLIRTVAMLVIGIAGLGLAFVAIGTVLSGAATVIGAVGGAIAFLLSPVGILVAGVVALGAAFAYIAANTGLGDTLRSLWSGLTDGLAIITNFGSGLLAAFQSGGLSGAVQFFKDEFSNALNGIAAIAIVKGVEVVTAVGNGVSQAVPTMTKAMKDGAAALGPAFVGAMATQAPAFANGAAEMTKAIDQETPGVARRGGLMAGFLAGDFLIAMITYGPLFVAGMAIAAYHIGAGILDVTTAIAGWGLNAGAVFVASFGLGLIIKLPGIWAAIKTQFNNLIGTPVKEAFAEFGQWAVAGFQNGFGLVPLWDWVKAQFEHVLGDVKKLLGIASPSTVFAQIGVDVGQGFINGLTSKVSEIGSAAAAMYNAAAGPLNSLIALAGRAVSAASGSSAVGSAVNSAVGSPITPNPNVNLGQNGPYYPNTPHREGGGPVMANQAYIVGEKRPEIFVPSSSGRIIPNLDMLTTPQQGRNGAGQSIQNNFNGPFIFNGIQDVEDIMQKLGKLAKQKNKNPLMNGNW